MKEFYYCQTFHIVRFCHHTCLAAGRSAEFARGVFICKGRLCMSLKARARQHKRYIWSKEMVIYQ